MEGTFHLLPVSCSKCFSFVCRLALLVIVPQASNSNLKSLAPFSFLSLLLLTGTEWGKVAWEVVWEVV